MQTSKGYGKCSCRTRRYQLAGCTMPSTRPAPKAQCWVTRSTMITMCKLPVLPQYRNRQTKSYKVRFARSVPEQSRRTHATRRSLQNSNFGESESQARIKSSSVTYEGGECHADRSEYNDRQQDHNAGMAPLDHNCHLRWEYPVPTIYASRMRAVHRT